jgi:hypothetical protein
VAATGIGAWLRKQREARRWSRREMARRLIHAAQAAGDTTVPGIDHLCTYIRRWEMSRHDLTERYKLYYCTAFGILPEEWGTAPPPPPPKPKADSHPSARLPRSRPARALAQTTSTLSDGADPYMAASIVAGAQLRRATVEREALMIAHHSSDHAEQYQSTAPATVEQLRDDLGRLARLCDTGEPLAVLVDMRGSATGYTGCWSDGSGHANRPSCMSYSVPSMGSWESPISAWGARTRRES